MIDKVHSRLLQVSADELVDGLEGNRTRVFFFHVDVGRSRIPSLYRHRNAYTRRFKVRTKGLSVAQLTESRSERRSWQRVAEGDSMTVCFFGAEKREKS